jgi:hypothetical protein
MSEALKCFAYLVENVPLWIKSLEELEQKVKDRQNEVARVPVPVSQTVRKTGSSESIRPGEVNANCPEAMEITSAPQAGDIAHAQTTQQIQVAKRKRKTASLLTSISTPNKYRSRSTMIVYYDSAVQEAFEHLVRNIGTGRNHIRKARMNARMEALTNASTADGDDLSIHLPTRNTRNGASSGYGPTLAAGLRSARGLALRPDPGANGFLSGATDACTLADQALDKAQSACEHGAHQFLRDGDCADETSSTKESFREVLTVSEKELARLKTVEEKKIKIKDEERRQGPDDDDPESSSELHPGLMPPDEFGVALIEADDGEDDDELNDPAFSLPPYRRTMRT